ncbi:MAG: CDP-diacylglycerol--glycerol-3-phosphate 3-phosphatidyltransferase [Bdellovibrionota bacterium]
MPATNPENRILTLPNVLTMLRMAAIPGVAWVYHTQSLPNYEIWTTVIFGLAFITDQLDGWLARKMNCLTQFGKLMDPLADKLLVITGLMLLVEKSMVPLWIALALVVREVAINSLRSFALQLGIVLSSSMMARTKSYFEGFAIGLAFLGPSFHWLGMPWNAMANLCFYISLILAYTSAYTYVVKVFGTPKASL